MAIISDITESYHLIDIDPFIMNESTIAAFIPRVSNLTKPAICASCRSLA